jgi:hypothetical protein
METILKITEKPVVDELTTFLKKLTPEEQQRINDFFLGMKFKAQLTSKTQQVG